MVNIESIGLQHYLRKILFNTSSLEMLMHLSGILQCNTCAGRMVPPKIKLFINLGVRMVVFNEEFHLLKVSECLEGKVQRLGIVSRRLFQILRMS